ncbi:hypothetical protein [Niallia sp. 03133]|uniref:hypothetical protein n=1 Tax=Niallia sp. 03133 TaxID=3458060 RepID=UPI004043A324
MNYFQQKIAVIKEDVNKDTSEILHLFQTWLNILFTIIGVISIPFFILLLLQL